ncbi:hypothetical protein ACFV8T_38835 [Streptomyces sp. NPDC059832]|uniref:hypothetical protein n=1 Tax=Streptomyces sp. NPDC059832 TaxID=3346966 RepID=UPI00365D2850
MTATSQSVVLAPLNCFRHVISSGRDDLLTDIGFRNASIPAALVDLLGKPVAEASALRIPTAGYGGHTGIRAGHGISSADNPPSPMDELGWKSVGVLELTALPVIDEKCWVSWVRKADALPVNGGDAAQTAIKVIDGGIEVSPMVTGSCSTRLHERRSVLVEPAARQVRPPSGRLLHPSLRPRTQLHVPGHIA